MSCTKEFGLYLLNNCTVFVVQSLSHVWLFVTPWTVTHPRLLCPPLSPRVRSNSYSSTWWCYLTISSFAAPFSFCPQSFPASGSFPVSQLFTSGGQSIGACPVCTSNGTCPESSRHTSASPFPVFAYFPLFSVSTSDTTFCLVIHASFSLINSPSQNWG